MTEMEHLLLLKAEEQLESAHRDIKALRFGLTEKEPGQPLDNAERIVEEFSDTLGTMELLRDLGYLPRAYDPVRVKYKKEKIKDMLRYSREQGMISD